MARPSLDGGEQVKAGRDMCPETSPHLTDIGEARGWRVSLSAVLLSPEPLHWDCQITIGHPVKYKFQINNKHMHALHNYLLTRAHTHTHTMYTQRLSFLPDRLLPERSASRSVFPQDHREQACPRPAQTQPLSHPRGNWEKSSF